MWLQEAAPLQPRHACTGTGAHAAGSRGRGATAGVGASAGLGGLGMCGVRQGRVALCGCLWEWRSAVHVCAVQGRRGEGGGDEGQGMRQ